MRRTCFLVLFSLGALAAAFGSRDSFARPAPVSEHRVPVIDNGSVTEPRAALFSGTGSAGTESPATLAALTDTVMYGGTRWAADSMRWEAIRGGLWTFDSGVGSAFGATGPNKPAGYHTLMEGWYGIDQSLNPQPWFRRSPTCAISGSYSLWAGITAAEANAMCYVAGQGYGNNWNLEIRKTFAYGGTGNVTLSYQYRIESEDGGDYSYVRIDTSGTGAAYDIELAAYTGLHAGTATSTLTRGSSLPSTARNIVLKFAFNSDDAYSDEDGYFPTTCGGVAFDNVSLSGAITDFTDFESGMNGWTQVVQQTAEGDYSNVVNRNTDLPAPMASCACSIRDSVLVFFDEWGGHSYRQDNIAASPWIDLKRGGDAGRPGKLIIYDIYGEMPLANYIFLQLRVRWYPSICPTTGLVYRTPWRDQATVFYYGDTPYCSPPGFPRAWDYSPLIETGAEQVQIGIGVINLCSLADYFNPCSGVTNSTPWIDNVRLGVYGLQHAPNVYLAAPDYLQDSFATDGSLNPASTGRLDVNRLSAASPLPGTVLGDTLCVRGDGGNEEVRLVFHVRPGPFTGSLALAIRSTRWTPEPSLGAGWYSARMDTAEQGHVRTLAVWMSTFHESDPGFRGTDRTADPLDPSQLENEILPDHVFTPGTRIDYFIAARYLPPDPRNPGGTYWMVMPDTTGRRYFEAEILPSSMAADTTWNCTLYVDHHQDWNVSDHLLEQQGLTASLGAGGNNQEGTRYDRWDVFTGPSWQFSFGRATGTHFGASVDQALAYQNIVWHSGRLALMQLTDEDAGILGSWLTLRAGSRFWGSGDGLASAMMSSGEPSAALFLANILGVTRTCNTARDVNCPGGSALDSTYCLPTAGVAGAAFNVTTATSVRGNGCYDNLSFDVINRNTAVATSKGQLAYVKNGAAAQFASVTNFDVTRNYKTVLDGFGIDKARTTPANPHARSSCMNAGASLARTDAILDWFSAALSCTTIQPGAVPDPGGLKPPRFRTSLGNAAPNPTGGATRIQFTNGVEGGVVTLKVFDVTGRLVRTLLLTQKSAAGVHELLWDGRTDGGSPVPGGMYFYKLTAPGYEAAKKLVIIR